MAKASEVDNGGQSGVGDPYYCQECKRNHTKGKIYKEHLNFARFESKEEASDDVEPDELELEDNDTIEEERDILDEMDEAEIKDEIEEDEDIIDEDLTLDKDESSCVDAVKKLPGVG